MTSSQNDPSDIDPEALCLYREGFNVNCREAVKAGAASVEGRGISGYLPNADRRATLLVTDDWALAQLEELLPRLHLAMVRVFPAARNCLALLQRDSTWPVRARTTAMLHRGLETLQQPAPPESLTIQPVARPPHQPDGVSLRDAVVESIEADPLMPPEQVLKLPPSLQVFAAVDTEGTIRATSASSYAGNFVDVSFVTTHPDWRRRGVAVAMTAHALRAANDHGPTVASQEATDRDVRSTGDSALRKSARCTASLASCERPALMPRADPRKQAGVIPLPEK